MRTMKLIRDNLYPENIASAIKRADVYGYCDRMTMTIHLVSRNFDESLTDEEKSSILTHVMIHNYPMFVAFDN